ncbi:MAG: hypothetical protein NTU47_16140 [Ignavibacteriales bacterium]|nr:hypothetical protein [Ignavibacteriales bacterium]
MNVNTKFSSAQFPTYTPHGQSTVMKQRRPMAGEAKEVAPGKKTASEKIVKGAAHEDAADSVISDTEKQYFEDLFPTSADEIRSYSPYGRNGMKLSADVGSLVDMKG